MQRAVLLPPRHIFTWKVIETPVTWYRAEESFSVGVTAEIN